MPQLEFRAIRAVTPRWRLDIMVRWVSTAGGRKTTDLRRCGGACRHVCFFAPQKAQAVDCAAGGGAKKAAPCGQFRRGPARL